MTITDQRIICGSNQGGETGLPSWPDRSIDVFVTDPPYSARVHSASRRGLTDYKERKGAGARDRRVRDLGFDHLRPVDRKRMADQMGRLARRWVLVFCDLESAHLWRANLEGAGLEYVRTGIWHKLGSTPQLTGDRPAASVEAIVIAHQTKANGKPMRKQWNGGGRHAWWSFPEPDETVLLEHAIAMDRGHNGSRVHTTQKPLPLMVELVDLFSAPGELVADPYAGSGTTGVACRQLGRRFIGWEIDERYAEIASRRIAGLAPVPSDTQQELFA